MGNSFKKNDNRKMVSIRIDKKLHDIIVKRAAKVGITKTGYLEAIFKHEIDLNNVEKRYLKEN